MANLEGPHGQKLLAAAITLSDGVPAGGAAVFLIRDGSPGIVGADGKDVPKRTGYLIVNHVVALAELPVTRVIRPNAK